MNTDIEKCLSLIYEIEGLLHVMNSRSLESLPTTVKTLLTQKSEQLARLLSFGIDTGVQAAVEMFEQQAETDNDDKNESEERLAETVEYEQMEDSQPEAASADDQLTHLDEAQAEEDEADTENAEIEDSAIDYYGEIAAKKNAGQLILQQITVNDRFRFIRELFGGSAPAFKAIVDEVSTFENPEKVAEYLSEKQNIDVTRGAGKELLAVLTRNMQ